MLSPGTALQKKMDVERCAKITVFAQKAKNSIFFRLCYENIENSWTWTSNIELELWKSAFELRKPVLFELNFQIPYLTSKILQFFSNYASWFQEVPDSKHPKSLN